MPEIINNVTTGGALLHEVFQETVKQAFVSAGFPRYEYDTTTGRYKNVVDGTDLEYDVRFAKVFEINEEAMDYRPICMTMVGDWLDPNLIPLSDGVYSEVYTYMRTHHRIFKINSSGSVLSSSYAYCDTYVAVDSYGAFYGYDQRQFVYLNPETGYFVTVGLGFFNANTSSPYRVKIPVVLLRYDYASNSISFPSRVAVDARDDTSNRQSYVSLASKVYKYETSTDVFYSMFLLTHELTPPNQPRRILLLVVRYSKTNKTVSAWTKRVVDDVYNGVPWSSILPSTESVSQWNITSYLLPHVFESNNNRPVIPPYGFKELVSTVSSPTSIAGNLLIFSVGYLERSLLMRAVKIPFTLDLDTSNPGNSSVSLDYSSSSLYGRFHIMQSFHNGYMYSDLSKIEFPRRSTYTPPANYAFKVSDYANINYNRAVMVVNNDFDTDSRLSISIFLHIGWDSVNDPLGLYEDPRMMINNIELTPGGGVYFTGFTHISKTTLKRFFLVSKHHPDIYTITQIRDNNLSMSGYPDTRSSNFIVSFRDKIPDGVSFGSSLSSRLIQPYIVKISNPNIYSYQLDPSNSNNEKTTYSRNNSLFLTNLIWVNYYNSGYFVPVFFLSKPGGDGIWFRANTIYFGIPSYNSTSFSPHKCFVVSGLPLEIRTAYLYSGYDRPFTYYGDQVNSTISLVTKLIVSQNKHHISLVGIQGGNYLKFVDMSIYSIEQNIEQNYVQSFPLYFHFSNVITGNGGRARDKVCPFSNIPIYIPANLGSPLTISRAVNPNIYIKQLYQGRVFSSFNYSPTSKLASYTQVPLRPDPQKTVDMPQSVVFIGYWHPDAGNFGVHTTPILTFPDQREVIQVVDKSNTMVVGDYLYVNDQSGNRLKYVVTNFYTANLYQDTNTVNTANYRILIAVRIE
jgi:hypothetical protein